jgi:hypothetical protein
MSTFFPEPRLASAIVRVADAFRIAISGEPPGAGLILRTVNGTAALFLGKRSPDADRYQ